MTVKGARIRGIRFARLAEPVHNLETALAALRGRMLLFPKFSNDAAFNGRGSGDARRGVFPCFDGFRHTSPQKWIAKGRKSDYPT